MSQIYKRILQTSNMEQFNLNNNIEKEEILARNIPIGTLEQLKIIRDVATRGVIIYELLQMYGNYHTDSTSKLINKNIQIISKITGEESGEIQELVSDFAQKEPTSKIKQLKQKYIAEGIRNTYNITDPAKIEKKAQEKRSMRFNLPADFKKELPFSRGWAGKIDEAIEWYYGCRFNDRFEEVEFLADIIRLILDADDDLTEYKIQTNYGYHVKSLYNSDCELANIVFNRSIDQITYGDILDQYASSINRTDTRSEKINKINDALVETLILYNHRRYKDESYLRKPNWVRYSYELYVSFLLSKFNVDIHASTWNGANRSKLYLSEASCDEVIEAGEKLVWMSAKKKNAHYKQIAKSKDPKRIINEGKKLACKREPSAEIDINSIFKNHRDSPDIRVQLLENLLSSRSKNIYEKYLNPEEYLINDN